MNRPAFLIVVSAFSLSACGGSGSNGPATSPPPPVTTPSPSPTPTTNTDIGDLIVSEKFDTVSATLQTALATPSGIVESAANRTGPFSITYNASAQTYSLEFEGQTSQFASSDQLASRFTGEQRFANGSGGYLTLVTYPYLSAFPNKYVGLGYWQENEVSAGQQDTQLTAFSYGFETLIAEVPQTGSAHWQTDVLGFLAKPGEELAIIQGLGGFNIDFSAGVYRMLATVSESDVVTNGGIMGALFLNSGGTIDSSGKFSGLLTYRGSSNLLTGRMSGSLYGPGAAELGGVFDAANSAGIKLTGAFTGQRSNATGDSQGIRNLTLTDLVAGERLFGDQVSLGWTQYDGVDGYSSVGAGGTTGSVDVEPGGIVSLNSGFAYSPDPADITSSNDRFTVYETMVQGNPTTISLFKSGSENSQIELTYTSFFKRRSSTPDALPDGTTGRRFEDKYVVFGVETPDSLLAARTGAATYSGVVYGTGASMGGLLYDIGGTSRFSVDFSGNTYSGQLNLEGVEANGAFRDFGAWSFSSVMNAGFMVLAELQGPTGTEIGSYIKPVFYGPTGQEIGATFDARTGADPNLVYADPDVVYMSGVTLAKED